MEIVHIVPFADPAGVVRELRVTPPPEGLVLLPEPDAPRSEFVAAAKSTKAFVIRLMSFRAFVSVLRHIARMYADDGSLATAILPDVRGDIRATVSVFVTPFEGAAGTTSYDEEPGMEFGYAHGRDLDGLQVHVRVSAVMTTADVLAIADAWLRRLEPVQRFDLVSERQAR